MRAARRTRTEAALTPPAPTSLLSSWEKLLLPSYFAPGTSPATGRPPSAREVEAQRYNVYTTAQECCRRRSFPAEFEPGRKEREQGEMGVREVWVNRHGSESLVRGVFSRLAPPLRPSLFRFRDVCDRLSLSLLPTRQWFQVRRVDSRPSVRRTATIANAPVSGAFQYWIPSVFATLRPGMTLLVLSTPPTRPKSNPWTYQLPLLCRPVPLSSRPDALRSQATLRPGTTPQLLALSTPPFSDFTHARLVCTQRVLAGGIANAPLSFLSSTAPLPSLLPSQGSALPLPDTFRLPAVVLENFLEQDQKVELAALELPSALTLLAECFNVPNQTRCSFTDEFTNDKYRNLLTVRASVTYRVV
ncbi:hypothetical protein R3P38DRAFT_3213902 [Favolaschia claudopus]|uniref:Uncharacterized protein n=1 Tax=Favolaschia claudopus TaxID=2862362 RepID=A0AAW0AC30_9AGAR